MDPTIVKYLPATKFPPSLIVLEPTIKLIIALGDFLLILEQNLWLSCSLVSEMKCLNFEAVGSMEA